MRGEIEYGNILKSVYQRIAEGGQYRTSDLLPLVQKDCELTDEQMAERTKGDNSPKVQKNVQWALTHLYGSGLINKVSRGLYEITPQKEELFKMSGEEFEKLVRAIYKSRESEKRNKSENKSKANVQNAQEGLVESDDKVTEYHPQKILLESIEQSSDDEAKCDGGTDPLNMSLSCLLAEPDTKTKDGRKALKEKKQSLAQQLEDILWAIRFYDFPIDPQEILKKVEQHSQDKEEDYKLSFDFGTIDEKCGMLSKCDIYVSQNKDAVPLNIKPIFKATYLAAMLMKDGIIPSRPSKEFIELVRYLYEMLPTNGKAQDDENGIVNDKKKFEADALGNQLNGIRNAVKEQIPNLLIAQKFAVEGYRNKPFAVQKADESIRKQIRKAFNLN